MLGPQFDIYKNMGKNDHIMTVLGAKPNEAQSKYASPNDPEYTRYGYARLISPNAGTEAPRPHEEEGGQQAMFQQWEKPRAAEVDMLFVNKEAKSVVPTLLGVAQNEMYKRFGSAGELAPSHDLSAHSSKLVSHLQRSGAVDPTHSTAVTNEITSNDALQQMTTMSWEGVGSYTEKVSPEERAAGFRTAKNVLRAGRVRKSGQSQFQQGELPFE